jgi:hypothetical protein
MYERLPQTDRNTLSFSPPWQSDARVDKNATSFPGSFYKNVAWLRSLLRNANTRKSKAL